MMSISNSQLILLTYLADYDFKENDPEIDAQRSSANLIKEQEKDSIAAKNDGESQVI